MKKIHKEKRSLTEDSTSVRIEQHLDALIEEQKVRDRWLHHLIWGGMALMFLITFVSFSGELVQKTLRLFRSPLENIRLEQSAQIKGEILQSTPEAVSLNKLRQWIHQYNNDFYGPGLPRQDETFLLAWATFGKREKEDVFHLNRPFAGNLNQSWRDWLTGKTRLKKEYGGYYNPVFSAIAQKLSQLRQKQAVLLQQPLPRFLTDSLATRTKIAGISPFDLRKSLADYVRENSYVMENESRLASKIDARLYERDIRLGLLAVRIGREYGFKRNAALFGWMTAGYKGGARLSRLRGRAAVYMLKDSLKMAWNRFYDHYENMAARVEQLSRQDNPVFILQNPLGMVLQAKRVGRFGARRKNNYGRVYKHHGIDLKAPLGQAVYPVAPGWVSYVGYQARGHGNHVRIVHDHGWTSVYSHLQDDHVWRKLRERYLREGPFWMEAYEVLATVGTSGNIPANDAQYGYPHLHLEISRHGKRIDPQKLFRETIRFVSK
ncbi:MAG TPA: M23 family metallopeptidase [Caldithrix abyssi]|uniref:M23 family metallopeptidase n=1 Tax=Caldithrix abyssi TaxID=187145 RepID=A0A7V1LK10_CALAY|nr:M23 family metallopeptidase [Caldithrix abyssi]